MSRAVPDLAAGLYLISTPIGSARDITLRALDVLKAADELAAEDTRTARKLLDIHGISLSGRRLTSYHDHSGAGSRARLVEAIRAGRSVAYMSEAGTPLIADPGYGLVRSVREEGLAVVAVPGPSAVITALTVAGLPTDRFMFAGFPPSARSARRTFLSEFASCRATLVFYESGKRIVSCLEDMVSMFGADSKAALCRELTKKFEETRRATLGDLLNSVVADPPKGELVVLVRPAERPDAEGDVDAALAKALVTMRVRDAADTVAAAFGLPRREIYQRALKLKSEEKGE